MSKERKKFSYPSVCFAILFLLILALAFTGIWFNTRYVAYEIFQTSMQDTLYEGDWVLGIPGKKAQRGDIVIVDVSTRRNEFSDDNIIKRLIAVGGDSVKCENGVVFLKEQGGEYEPLEEPYVKGTTGSFAEHVLREGEIFVMGDNRSSSLDSRSLSQPLLYEEIAAVVPSWSVEGKGAIARWAKFRQSFTNCFNG